jgi:hypothetical protein
MDATPGNSPKPTTATKAARAATARVNQTRILQCPRCKRPAKLRTRDLGIARVGSNA